jgi:hypothetical protein
MATPAPAEMTNCQIDVSDNERITKHLRASDPPKFVTEFDYRASICRIKHSSCGVVSVDYEVDVVVLCGWEHANPVVFDIGPNNLSAATQFAACVKRQLQQSGKSCCIGNANLLRNTLASRQCPTERAPHNLQKIH